MQKNTVNFQRGISVANAEKPTSKHNLKRTIMKTVKKWPGMLLALLALGISGSAAGQNSNWYWEQKLEAAGGSDELVIKDIGHSYTQFPSGHRDWSIVVGYFTGDFTLNGRTVSSSGGRDGFIARVENGRIDWFTRFGGMNDDECTAVAVDLAGQPYVTGFYDDDSFVMGDNLLTPSSLTMPSGVTRSKTAAASKTPILAKFTSIGSISLFEVLDTEGEGRGISLSPQNDGTFSTGDLFLTGYFTDSIRNYTCLNCYTQNPINTGEKAFITRYSTTGNVLWSNFIDDGTSWGNGVTQEGDFIDPNTLLRVSDQDVFVTGAYVGSAEINYYSGSQPALYSYNSVDMNSFVAKLDYTTGRFEWADAIYSTGSDEGTAISIWHSFGEVYLTGNFTGSQLDFNGGSTTISAYGNSDIYIARYNNSGVCQWAQAIGSSAHNEYATDIDAYNYDAITLFIAGIYEDNADFSGRILPSVGASGDEDLFIARIDRSNGNTEWAEGIDGREQVSSDLFGSHIGARITYDPTSADSLYVAGNFVSSENPEFTNVLSTSKPVAGFVAQHGECFCPKPTAFNVTRFGLASTVSANWTESSFQGCMQNYYIRYVPLGPGTPGISGPYAFGTNNATITGLNPVLYQWELVTDCGSTSNVSPPVVKSLPTSSPENTVSVYPNPTEDLLNISSGEGIETIVVTDALGRTLLTENLSGEMPATWQLSLAQMKTGVYLITVRSATESRVFRIIKN